MADGFFGDLLRIEALELGRPAAEADRGIRAVRIGVVADVEVRTELRGCQIEAAINRVIAGDDGRKNNREPGSEKQQLFDGRSTGVLRAFYDRVCRT